MAKEVRTRYAPSPTGPQHIGGIRSALFGWLWARHNNGKFIIRIEDTDQKRYVEGSVEHLAEVWQWLGLDWDEGLGKAGDFGPYVQSERRELHEEWANWLVEHDKAYKCFCTSERLQAVNEERRKNKQPPGYDRHCRNLSADEVAQKEAEGLSYVIRFKMPLDGVTQAHDLVQGDVTFENNKLQDVVLLKSDKFPTYHLAHVVDDHFMEISHVTRANEWLPSLPVHINLWEAFGWKKPEYAHLPVLLNPNGKGKLSKRSEAFADGGRKVPVLAAEFKEGGYLPEAVLNFLSNIGWTFGDDQEVFTLKQAIERFDLSAVNPSNSAYPIEKLDWLNGIYIREKPVEELAPLLGEKLEDSGYKVNQERLLQVTPVVQTRMKTLNEFVDLAGFLFANWVDFQAPTAEMLIPKKMDAGGAKAMLQASHDLLTNSDSVEHTAMYESFKELVQELGLKNGQVFGGIRVAITGQKVSPPTFETIEILGKEESLRRIRLAIDTLDTRV